MPSTDPYPYITAAYGLVFSFIFGYMAYILLERRKLRLLLQSLDDKERI